jgi:hypothetical protein
MTERNDEQRRNENLIRGARDRNATKKQSIMIEK